MPQRLADQPELWLGVTRMSSNLPCVSLAVIDASLMSNLTFYILSHRGAAYGVETLDRLLGTT
jgi:hypothetical protein